MKIRNIVLLGATFMAHALAYASSEERLPDNSNTNPRIRIPAAAAATAKGPIVLRHNVGYLDHHLLKLRVKNLENAHITITTSDPETRLVNVAGRSLPPYVTVPLNANDPNRLKLVPNLAGYEDLHGKEFFTDLSLIPNEERTAIGRTLKVWHDIPLDMMIPKSDALGFDIKVNVRSEGYTLTSKILPIGAIGTGILIEGLPKESKINISGFYETNTPKKNLFNLN